MLSWLLFNNKNYMVYKIIQFWNKAIAKIEFYK